MIIVIIVIIITVVVVVVAIIIAVIEARCYDVGANAVTAPFQRRVSGRNIKMRWGRCCWRLPM